MDDDPAVRIAGLRITLSDVIKLLIAIAGVLAAWYALSAQVNALSLRVDGDEKQQAIFLRSDVQAVRDESILEELKIFQTNVNQRLDRIEHKIDGEK